MNKQIKYHQKTNEILELYKKNEKLAFKLLFDTYYIPLVLFVNKIIQNEHSSEDIVQETLISFWQKESLSNVKTNLDSFLFRSVKNKTLNYLNSKNKRQEVFMSITEEHLKEEVLINEDDEQCIKLYKTIELLPQERRRAFELVYIEGHKYKEAAAILGISINTVQTQLRRSLQFLRETLTGLDNLE